jgi:hypothetical protein
MGKRHRHSFGGLIAKKEDGIESTPGSRPEFCPAALGFHQFLHNGKAEPGATKFAAFIGRSPEAVEGPLALFVAEAWTFVDNVYCDD